ncbi:MAG: 30S ribosomal protein S17e [Candidatus Altiarchaeota archaeon]|nr:30S ribosomal protein S17e [Candidatus Altiarchaeota archaeon]
MGNLKQTYLKRVGQKLLKEYPSQFTIDFNANKRKVQVLTDISSKGIRNKIAGFITRFMNRKSKAKD